MHEILWIFQPFIQFIFNNFNFHQHFKNHRQKILLEMVKCWQIWWVWRIFLYSIVYSGDQQHLSTCIWCRTLKNWMKVTLVWSFKIPHTMDALLVKISCKIQIFYIPVGWWKELDLRIIRQIDYIQRIPACQFGFAKFLWHAWKT